MISSSKGVRGIVLLGLLSLNHCGPVGEDAVDREAVSSLEQEVYFPGTETPNDLLNNNSGLGVMALYDGTPLICSAVYLGNRWVLTAKHCLEGATPTNVFASALTNPGPTRPVSPPAGSSSFGESVSFYSDTNIDLALLRLKSAISATYATPATGRIATSASMVGKTLLCAGFGWTKPSGEGAGRARKAWLPCVSRRSTHELRLQQNAEGRFMYYGDSGGPCFDTFSSPGGGGAVLASILTVFYTTAGGVTYDVEASVARDAPWSTWLRNTTGF